ncbi:MAG: DUF1566 domain-containing protein [Gallionella sp.]|nr:DUF1566 domain-containing protein [Gallionella sp.]
MKSKKTLLAVALSAGLFSVTSANAALELTLYYEGDYRGVYDTDLNITWMRNADLATSNTFGVSGIHVGGGMNWNTAQSWISAMNAANYLGFNDWRLPTTLQPDLSCSYHQTGSSISYGYNCTGSEMGHLFYNELGGTADSSILSSSDPDLALFQNVHPRYYWSGTEFLLGPGWAWFFRANEGTLSAYDKSAFFSAWAVRDGGAPVSAVPEPETYTMLLAGLGLLSFAARRRKQSA